MRLVKENGMLRSGGSTFRRVPMPGPATKYRSPRRPGGRAVGSSL